MDSRVWRVKMEKINVWSPVKVIQLLSKIENKLLDWDNQLLDLSLAQREEIKSIFERYEDYYLYEGDNRGEKRCLI